MVYAIVCFLQDFPLLVRVSPRFPAFLEDDAAEAIRRVRERLDIQTAVNLLRSYGQRHNRSELLRLAGIFAPNDTTIHQYTTLPGVPAISKLVLQAQNLKAAYRKIDEKFIFFKVAHNGQDTRPTARSLR